MRTHLSSILAVVLGILVVLLLLPLILLYPRVRDQEAQIMDLQEATNRLAGAVGERQELERLSGQVEELARLRRDNQELHRLRNEVRELRESKETAAAATAAAAPAPDAGVRSQVILLQRQVQQLLAENAQLREAQMQNQVRAESEVDATVPACLNNLRMLDGAKEQWALENQQLEGALPEWEEILPDLRGQAMPACPAQGVYTLNAIGVSPECTIPGHALP